jgi:hypothetical protein
MAGRVVGRGPAFGVAASEQPLLDCLDVFPRGVPVCPIVNEDIDPRRKKVFALAVEIPAMFVGIQLDPDARQTFALIRLIAGDKSVDRLHDSAGRGVGENVRQETIK